jgi:hypothetical protein
MIESDMFGLGKGLPTTSNVLMPFIVCVCGGYIARLIRSLALHTTREIQHQRETLHNKYIQLRGKCRYIE